MKFLNYLLITLLTFTFSNSFAQGDEEKSKESTLLSYEELDQETTYYLEKVEDVVTPNDNGEVQLYVYDFKADPISKEAVWVKPEDVYILYVRHYDNDASRFPLEVYLFPKLQTLVLGLWEFEEVPSTIDKRLPNLQYLDLQSTKISALPETIKECKHLEFLNIGGTKISSETKKTIQEWLPKVTIF